jgi:hypothetical protein
LGKATLVRSLGNDELRQNRPLAQRRQLWTIRLC